MKQYVLAAVVALMSGAAWAQTAPSSATPPASSEDYFVPLQAGTILVRARAAAVIPENFTSSVSVIGGKVGVTATPAPEVDFSYFFTDNIAAELIAASTRHEVAAHDSILGRVDVGSVYVLPPTLTVQYHFFPKDRFSPYVGAGATAAFFYDSQPAKPIVTKVGLDNAFGPAIQAGFDYALGGPWSLNADVKQIFIDTKARINQGTIVAKTSLSPTVVGVGIGYRF